MNLLKNIITESESFIQKNYFSFLVITVVIFAFILRYWHTKIGLPYLYYWDEPQTASTALKIMKTGDYNPHFFNYGSMMIYSNFVVDILHYLSLMGHPETAESYLTNMNEIKIKADTGWHWTISHPSFYHWNRVLTALLGTGTVLVTYLIGKHVFNKWIGLVAAVFLTILPFHITVSAVIITDAPVAFFVLTVVLFSIFFIRYKKPSYFILALVFVGISIATKYNAALTMLLPLIALIIVYFQSRESIKTYMWFLIPIIPIVIFFIIMPYAIIDLTTFLKHVGFEVRHYKINGHGSTTTIVPGWEHFIYQLHQFYKHIGLANTILVGLGIIGIFIRPLLGFILILPLMYIAYMTGMKVNFHRNFVQVYPFIAILFSSGIYTIYIFLKLIQKRIMLNKKWIANVSTLLITMSFVLPQSYTSFKRAITIHKTKDTRTKVIDELNTFNSVKKIVIAKELRIHSQDLKRLKIPYSVLPLLETSSRVAVKDTLYILPKNITSYRMARNKKRLEPMQKFIASINKASIIKTVIAGNGSTMIDIESVNPEIKGNTGTRIDTFSVNPEIIIVKNLPIKPIEINLDKTFKIDLKNCEMSTTYKGNPLAMYSSGSIDTQIYLLKKGKYNLVINAKGTKAFDEYAKLKLQVFSLDKDEKILLAEKTIATEPKYSEYTLQFSLNTDNNTSFVVSFINDKGRKQPKEDRNVYLKSIVLKK